MQRVIIDCDPGIDDAMAILLAVSKLDVLGLTIVHGNLGGQEGLQQLGRNARRVLRLAGKPDVPVVLGEAKPLQRDAHKGAPFVHGDDGLGDVLDEQAQKEKEKEFLVDAAGWIGDTVMAHPPNTVALIALGPLTNVARAVERRPEIGQRLVGLFAMGGNFFVPGNISTNAEANVFNDAEGANVVMQRFARVVLSPLDVTTRTHFGASFLDALALQAPLVGGFIRQIAQKYLAFHREYFEGERAHCDVHDSTAVASLLWPDLFSDSRSSWVRVEGGDGLCRGVCVADFRGSIQNALAWERNVLIHFNVDSKEFLARYVAAIVELDQRLTKQAA